MDMIISSYSTLLCSSSPSSPLFLSSPPLNSKIFAVSVTSVTDNDKSSSNSSSRRRRNGTINAAANMPVTKTTMNLGFKSLLDTLSIDVHRAEGRALNVPLLAPFTIASSRVENVAIRVELGNGCVGWGEAPILPFVTTEDQATALVKASEACDFLKLSRPMALSLVLSEIGGLLSGHQFASVRAGVEMALIDAAANSIGIPLWRLFGGVSNTITTDITIPIVSSVEAAKLSSKYRQQGFNTLKLKVGKNLNADIEVLKAIRVAHPECSFILDANEGYTANEAIRVLEKLHEMGVTPILFEQPVHRDDWDGLGHVTLVAKEKYGISVAADESCRSMLDVQKIVKENLADVINIKLAKTGVLGALEIIEFARQSGLDLMIGGMVETRLAMGFAGHLAAGLGCFKFIDLDTPLLLSEDPVVGGYKVSGAVYKFTNARGHGGFLHWDNIAWKGNVSIIDTIHAALEVHSLLPKTKLIDPPVDAYSFVGIDAFGALGSDALPLPFTVGSTNRYNCVSNVMKSDIKLESVQSARKKLNMVIDTEGHCGEDVDSQLDHRASERTSEPPLLDSGFEVRE